MCGTDLTAEMGGAVKAGKLFGKHDDATKAETEARQIELPKAWGDLSTKEERDLLCVDEMKQPMAKGKARDGINVSDVKQIVPVSDELKALMPIFNSEQQLLRSDMPFGGSHCFIMTYFDCH